MSKIRLIGSGLFALSLCGFIQMASATAAYADREDGEPLTQKERNRILNDISADILSINNRDEAEPAPVRRTVTTTTSTRSSVVPVHTPPARASDAPVALTQEMKTVEVTEAPAIADTPAPVLSQPGIIDLKGLLLASGAVPADQIKFGDNNYLTWSSNGLYGSARQSPLPPSQPLVAAAKNYLDNAESMCHGEFGKKMGQLLTLGELEVMDVDVTCIDGNNEAASAVLFVAGNGMYAVIVEEGTVEHLPAAFTHRDAIIEAAKRGPKRGAVVTPPPPSLPVEEYAAVVAVPPPVPVPEPVPEPVAAHAPQQQQPVQHAASHMSDTWSQVKDQASKLKVVVGVDTSNYKYREKTDDADPFMNMSAHPIGLNVAITTPPVWEDYYLRAEGRGVLSVAKYNSASGTSQGKANNFAEIRGLVGKDFPLGANNTVAPYTGLGYRYLYNDPRGATSIGLIGYRRTSHYTYVPLGVTDTYAFSDKYAVSANFEYDFFTHGIQKSYLADVDPSLGTVENTQQHGRGMRGELLFHANSWAVGPWFNYWYIKDSNIVPIPGAPGQGGQEPDNKTHEFGVKITKRLW